MERFYIDKNGVLRLKGFCEKATIFLDGYYGVKHGYYNVVSRTDRTLTRVIGDVWKKYASYSYPELMAKIDKRASWKSIESVLATI